MEKSIKIWKLENRWFEWEDKIMEKYENYKHYLKDNISIIAEKINELLYSNKGMILF